MTATATPIRECDHALDYLYSMLEGEAKTRFEAHLATCPRCQEELEAFGKVRVVAQQSLKTVEPSERLSGALHAQLMHAAAQRKPRGKVMPFLRRVISHPSYAAAAALVLVGGAVGLQYSRGKLMMPTAAHSEQAPSPVTAATPPAPDVPAAAPATGIAADPSAAQPGATKTTEMLLDEKDKAPPQGGAPTGKLVVTAEPKSEPKLDGLLREKAGSNEPAKSRAASDKSADYKSTFGAAKDANSNGLVEDLTDRRAITARLNKKAATGSSADGDAMLGGDVAGGAGTSTGKGYASPSGAKAPAPSLERGRSSGDGQAAPRTETAKEAPPPPPAAPPRQSAAPTAPAPKPVAVPQKRAPAEGGEAKPSVREQEARRDDNSRNAGPPPVAQQVARPQADEPAPARASTTPSNHASKPRAADDSNAPPAETPALSSAATKNDEESVRREPVAKVEVEPQDDVDKERSRAAQLAQSGKCSEAAAIYGRLDKKVPDRLNAQDRLSYEHCLTALGRFDTAQDQLKQMRAGKSQGSLPAAAINAEQKNIDVQRKRAAERNAEPPMANEQREPRNASRPKKAKAKASASQSDAYEAAPADNAAKKFSY